MTWCCTLLLLYPPVHQLDGPTYKPDPGKCSSGTSCCWNLFLCLFKPPERQEAGRPQHDWHYILLQQEKQSLFRQNDGTVSYHSQHCASFACPEVSATEVSRGRRDEGPREMQKLHKDSAEACKMHVITWFYMPNTLMKTANTTAIFCLQITAIWGTCCSAAGRHVTKASLLFLESEMHPI